MRRLALDTIAPQPWHNRAGSTRLIAEGRFGPDEAAAPDWRISVAEIGGCAPFSVFPGIDRQAVLIGGHALVLHAETPEAGGDIVFFAPGASACFSGEARLAVREADPGTRLFNLMTRRDRCVAELSVDRGSERWLPSGSVRLVLVIAGDYLTAAPAGALAAGEGLLAQADDAALGLQRMSPRGWLIAATIRPAPPTA